MLICLVGLRAKILWGQASGQPSLMATPALTLIILLFSSKLTVAVALETAMPPANRAQMSMDVRAVDATRGLV